MILKIDTTSEDFDSLSTIIGAGTSELAWFNVDRIKHSKELCILYAERYAKGVNDIPEAFLTDEVIRHLLISNPHTFKYLDGADKNEDLVKLTLERDGEMLQHMPLSIRKNTDMITIAIKQNANAYDYVSKVYKRKVEILDLYFSELKAQDKSMYYWGAGSRYVKNMPFDKVKPHMFFSFNFMIDILPKADLEHTLKSLKIVKKEIENERKSSRHWNNSEYYIEQYIRAIRDEYAGSSEFAEECIKLGVDFIDLNKFMEAD